MGKGAPAPCPRVFFWRREAAWARRWRAFAHPTRCQSLASLSLVTEFTEFAPCIVLVRQTPRLGRHNPLPPGRTRPRPLGECSDDGRTSPVRRKERLKVDGPQKVADESVIAIMKWRATGIAGLLFSLSEFYSH